MDTNRELTESSKKMNIIMEDDKESLKSDLDEFRTEKSSDKDTQ